MIPIVGSPVGWSSARSLAGVRDVELRTEGPFTSVATGNCPLRPGVSDGDHYAVCSRPTEIPARSWTEPALRLPAAEPSVLGHGSALTRLDQNADYALPSAARPLPWLPTQIAVMRANVVAGRQVPSVPVVGAAAAAGTHRTPRPA